MKCPHCGKTIERIGGIKVRQVLKLHVAIVHDNLSLREAYTLSEGSRRQKR